MNVVLDELLKYLELRETNTILPHEQTVSYNLKRLKEAMLNIGHLVDPLVIDRKSLVVLDGHHRLKVLQIIECPYVVCQMVDYSDSEIKVGTWYPIANISYEQFLKLDSLKGEKIDYETGKQAVENLKAPFMVLSKKEKKDSCYLVNPGSYKLMEMVAEQNYVLSLLSKASVDYIPEQDIRRSVENNNLVFYRRAYTKEEIIRTAQTHAPLPPKSTRHLIPGRIIRLNMKLGWLHHTREEATKELVNMLEHRVYSGNVRKYFEPVTVIY